MERSEAARADPTGEEPDGALRLDCEARIIKLRVRGAAIASDMDFLAYRALRAGVYSWVQAPFSFPRIPLRVLVLNSIPNRAR